MHGIVGCLVVFDGVDADEITEDFWATLLLKFNSMAHRNDPYKFLEDIGSERSLRFVAAANRICLKAFGDPTKSKSSLYPRILEILESDERIPIVSKMGKDASGNDLLYNLWKDSKVRAKGFLGKTAKQKNLGKHWHQRFTHSLVSSSIT